MSLRKLPDYIIRDVKPPSSECNDKNCPWHGKISLRKGILEGEVVSTKMTGTVTVLVEYLLYSKKYNRYERRRSKIHAHLPPCITVKEGDKVRIVEVRRLAKTVSHVVIGTLSKQS